ncbi:MAG TPA: DoxX family protein [Puia sp.]|jgi:putative oxidoreductase|nr:DoxX family protein [Puia sp.]
MNNFFSPKSLMQSNGIACVRIIVGIFLIYHGREVFDAEKMKEYATWEMFKHSSSPTFIPYLGKASEFISGLLLAAGLFTRIACLIIIGTMLYISFIIGSGKIWMDDQYPFLFAILALVFIFTGPGNFSIDKIIF